MKTLYLHIGTPKTGTTAIQAFLEKNSDLLRQCGYNYPLMSLPWSDVPSRRNGHFFIMKKDSTQELTAIWHEHIAYGLSMLHREFELYDNVILSDEDLWNSIWYDPASFLQVLPEDAGAHNYRVQIIVYLRRQDLFLTSLWNQKVKKGKTSEPLPLFVKHHMEEKPLYTDYDQTLTRLADIFGADALIVRRYETASWVNQSICDDFLTAVGLDCSLPFVSSKETPANLSLSESAAEIQRIVNSADFLSPEEKQRFAKIRNELPQSVSPQSKALNFPERHLSVKEADSVLAHFKEGNNHVAQVWFSDGKPLFSESITAPAIRQRLSSEELSDDIIYFFLSVTHDLYMQNQELSHWARPFMHITRILRHPLAAIRHLL